MPARAASAPPYARPARFARPAQRGAAPSLSHVAAVCFDLGGTILDDGAGRKRRLAKLLDPQLLDRKQPALDRLYRRHFLTRDWSEREALSALERDLGVPDLARRFREHAPERPPRVYRDVRPTLTALAGLRLAVISNCSARDRDRFAALDIRSAFQPCVFSCEVAHAKPDPQPFLRAQRLLDLPAERILHVGDDPIGDVAAAARLGWHAIQLHRERNRPVCAAASAVIPSLSALVPLLQGALVE